MKMDDIEKVSIIIPTFNRKNELRKCLESIYKQDYPDFEVLIIDNSSTDGTKEMILKEYPNVRVFCSKKNLYACRSRNIGVAKSLGPYLWFLDSDSVIVNSDCLSLMVKLIKLDKNIGCIGATVYLCSDKSARIGLPQKNIFNMFSDWDKERFQSVECDYIPLPNLLTTKEVLLKIGGFVEKYNYLFEDNDLGIKIIKRGLKNILDRRTIVLHPLKPAPRNFKKGYIFYRNSFLYIFLNYNYSEWCKIIMGNIRNSRFIQRDSPHYLDAKHLKLLDKITVYLGFVLGFISSVIFFFTPRGIKTKYGKINYLAQYIKNKNLQNDLCQ